MLPAAVSLLRGVAAAPDGTALLPAAASSRESRCDRLKRRRESGQRERCVIFYHVPKTAGMSFYFDLVETDKLPYKPMAGHA